MVLLSGQETGKSDSLKLRYNIKFLVPPCGVYTLSFCAGLVMFLLVNSQRGIVHYFKSQFMDRTFKGLYSPNGFDLALLIPYFIVMVILAGYGMHRYALVWMYYRNRKNRTTEPAAKFEDLPRVTIQL